MSFANFILSAVSIVFRIFPSFRGLGRIYRIFNVGILSLGAIPTKTAKMKDGSKMFVDLRSNTEVDAFYRGEYDIHLIDLIRSLLDAESFFLDIGANIGFYSIAIATSLRSKDGSGKVIAFEPYEGNYNKLLENISLNDLGNYCFAQKIGLSDASIDSEITLREDFINGSGTGNAAIPTNTQFDEGFRRVPIKLNQLDEIWPSLTDGIRKIGFIKIDIEGHEDYCLRGGLQTIKTNRPFILMEVNKPYYVVRGVDLDNVFLPLIPERYSLFRQKNRMWQKIYSLKECSTLDNVLLIPEEKLEHCYKVLSLT